MLSADKGKYASRIVPAAAPIAPAIANLMHKVLEGADFLYCSICQALVKKFGTASSKTANRMSKTEAITGIATIGNPAPVAPFIKPPRNKPETRTIKANRSISGTAAKRSFVHS